MIEIKSYEFYDKEEKIYKVCYVRQCIKCNKIYKEYSYFIDSEK